MSKANFNIAKAITLLSEVISEAAAIVPPRTLDVFGNEIDPEDDEPVAASEYAERCNESEDFSNEVTDTLELLKEEIDQVLEEQDDNEFDEPAWSSMDDEFDDDDDTDDADDDDDAEADDDEKADDDDAVQEELPLGDKTDDDTETPFTLDAETYDTMLNAYTELEERKEELARSLESASESISGILEDAETFRRGLDKTGLDQT
jgi:NurA-like 5'-3' nuclease